MSHADTPAKVTPPDPLFFFPPFTSIGVVVASKIPDHIPN